MDLRTILTRSKPTLILAILICTWMNLVSCQTPSNPTATQINMTPLPQNTIETGKTPEVENNSTSTNSMEDNGLETPTPATLSEDWACFGSSEYGMSCLSKGAWGGSSRLESSQISGLAKCTDNSLMVFSPYGLSQFDGEKWTSLDVDITNYSPISIACDGEATLWVAHSEGVSYIDYAQSSSWTDYPTRQLSLDISNTNLPQNIALTTKGTVWVQTKDSLAFFDKNSWSTFPNSKSPQPDAVFYGLALDSDEYPWTATDEGFLTIINKTWISITGGDLYSIQTMAVGEDGKMYIGTQYDGVYAYDDGSWTQYSSQSGVLSSDHVLSMDVDSQNRLWVGTTYGLDVFDGTNWITYRMDNSELIDNYISFLSVKGEGPNLPEQTDQGIGAISGTIVDEEGEPQANIQIDLCVEEEWIDYSGSYCSGQPFIQQTTTAEDGSFSFTDLPVGLYALAGEIKGDWDYLLINETGQKYRALVNDGKENNLGTLEIGK